MGVSELKRLYMGSPAGMAAIASLALLAHDASYAREASSPEVVSPAVGNIERFKPGVASDDRVIDYSYWTEFLRWAVIPMGPSLREGAPTVSPPMGTRRVYGHTSRYRLEGNRLALDYIDDQIKADLAAYKSELEALADQLDITALPRPEQLAYWMNLHNVAVVEALAQSYPLMAPSLGKFGPNNSPLDEAKIINVSGVSLSPKEIRQQIVYPHWDDPKVIYGFWRGEIGGPSLDRIAYSGVQMEQLLTDNAQEFVNSLRGVESFGGSLLVSRLYEDAADTYFPDFDAITDHMLLYANDDVKTLIMQKKDSIRYTAYESDVADLARGHLMPSYFASITGDGRFRVNGAVARLIEERQDKLIKAEKRGLRTGRVFFRPIQLPGQEEAEAQDSEPEAENKAPESE